jgi:branched-subunit amino acid aminotransferase/4-amino-4-deoxychorismate lyase
MALSLLFSFLIVYSLNKHYTGHTQRQQHFCLRCCCNLRLCAAFIMEKQQQQERERERDGDGDGRVLIYYRQFVSRQQSLASPFSLTTFFIFAINYQQQNTMTAAAAAAARSLSPRLLFLNAKKSIAVYGQMIEVVVESCVGVDQLHAPEYFKNK